MSFERRLVPAREDLTAAHLAEFSAASAHARPEPAQIVAAVADLRPKPDVDVNCDTQLLFGEAVNAYARKDGWAWIQAIDDGYVGYVQSDVLGAPAPATHRVATLNSNVYRAPSLKTPVIRQLPFGAQIEMHETRDGYVRIGPEEWLPGQHVTPIDDKVADWVSVAEMFLGVPYLWGGRSNQGIDCSGLVQLARQAGGYRCLRDSDMQATTEGETLPDSADLRRGDLIFWRGHVGVMADADVLVHANGHHMAVVREPLVDAITRIERAENTPVLRRARPFST